MSHSDLIIVFVKNLRLGKVKTRLAKDVGDEAAFKVYQSLLDITKSVTRELDFADVHIYFDTEIITEDWGQNESYLQVSGDLGQRMYDAFERGFNMGYRKVIGIGSDLPELSVDLLKESILVLDNTDTVFGPAEDGGYYLLGMNQMLPILFKDKPWSTKYLLNQTLKELHENNYSSTELITLNDIDNLKDLQNSILTAEFVDLISSKSSE